MNPTTSPLIRCRGFRLLFAESHTPFAKYISLVKGSRNQHFNMLPGLSGRCFQPRFSLREDVTPAAKPRHEFGLPNLGESQIGRSESFIQCDQRIKDAIKRSVVEYRNNFAQNKQKRSTGMMAVPCQKCVIRLAGVRRRVVVLNLQPLLDRSRHGGGSVNRCYGDMVEEWLPTGSVPAVYAKKRAVLGEDVDRKNRSGADHVGERKGRRARSQARSRLRRGNIENNE